jgi:hypothetical protein
MFKIFIKINLTICAFIIFCSYNLCYGQDLINTKANKNNQTITIPGGIADPATLVQLDMGYLNEGDLFLIDAFTLQDKGNIGGDNLTLIRSGESEGIVFFSMDTRDLEDRRYVPPNGRIQVWLHGVARVIKSGQVTLYMRAASAGSDSQTGRSQSQIRSYRLGKSEN